MSRKNWSKKPFTEDEHALMAWCELISNPSITQYDWELDLETGTWGEQNRRPANATHDEVRERLARGG